MDNTQKTSTETSKPTEMDLRLLTEDLTETECRALITLRGMAKRAAGASNLDAETRQADLVGECIRALERASVDWLSYEFNEREAGRPVELIPDAYKSYVSAQINAKFDERIAAITTNLTATDVLLAIGGLMACFDEICRYAGVNSGRFWSVAPDKLAELYATLDGYGVSKTYDGFSFVRAVTDAVKTSKKEPVH